MEKLRKVIYRIDDVTAYGSCFLIAANMLVITYSVIMRLIFGSPVSGLTDIVGFVSAAAAALSFGYTEKEKGFMQVDFVKEYFPKMIQKILHLIIGIISIAVLGLVSYRFLLYGISCLELGTVSWVMFLPYYPICFFLFVGCAIYCLTTLYHFAEEIVRWKGGRT